MSTTLDLSGRVALVTGASSGLGWRFARVLSAAGARVAVAARRAELLEQLATTIRADGGVALPVPTDVSDEASIRRAYDLAESTFGRVDTVIANAGTGSSSRTLDLSVEEFDRLVAVNLRGVFTTVREGARRMLAGPASDRGRIVIVSSITAQHVTPGLAVYSATKAAVAQMGRVLASEWARHGINVNMIAPGYIRTELTGDLLDSQRGARLLDQFPRRRAMDAGSLDAMLLYLCSDLSTQVTGSTFTLDDGQTL